MVVPAINADATPASMLAPNLLSSTFLPLDSRIPISKLHTVVLPFVPVTAIILSGFAIFFKKSLSIFIATFPGKKEALALIIFNDFSNLMQNIINFAT